MRKGLILFLFCLTLIFGLTACTPEPDGQAVKDTAKPSLTVTVVTYRPSADAEHLVPVTTEIPAAEFTPTRALEEMLKMDARETYPLWDSSTKVLGVTVDEKTKIATVNFNEGLRRNLGGSLGEILMVYMTVNTLTEIEGIHAVRFAVNGEPIATLDGHMDLTEPLERNEGIIVTE